MKIALIGATGFVGSSVTQELLARGHQVTALKSRRSVDARANLSGVSADAFDERAVAGAVQGHDAVISAFNPGWNDPQLYDRFMEGSGAIVRGVEASGVKRLLVVGGAGSLFVAPGVQLVDTQLFVDHAPANIVPGAKAARDALNALRGNSVLEWTFLCPPAFLAPGERTGQYRVGSDQLLMDGDKPAGISVEDLAVAITDEVERPRHVRTRFTVARANPMRGDG
jgi:uncharacterized protein